MWEIILPLFVLALLAYGFVRLMAVILPKERKQRRERKHARRRKRQADKVTDKVTDDAFFSIVQPLSGTHISDWFKR